MSKKSRKRQRPTDTGDGRHAVVDLDDPSIGQVARMLTGLAAADTRGAVGVCDREPPTCDWCYRPMVRVRGWWWCPSAPIVRQAQEQQAEQRRPNRLGAR